MPKCTFNVFPSQDSRYANEFNTAFTTQPVTLDMGNAEEILKRGAST